MCATKCGTQETNTQEKAWHVAKTVRLVHKFGLNKDHGKEDKV